MTGNKESLRMKLEDIAGELGNMSDYPAIGDYQKMALHLIVASISTELENSDEDIPDKDVEQAVAIFYENVFSELAKMANEVEKISRKNLTYKEATQKLFSIHADCENKTERKIKSRVKSKAIKRACYRALREVSNYVYDVMQI